MTRALEEYEILGIRTTIPFFVWLMREPDYLAGRFDTTYLDRLLASRRGQSFSEFSDADERHLAMAAALDAILRPSGTDSGAAGRPAAGAAWKIAGRQEALR
jgi:acetyl/propionyl-CoA carboxylase alpha subunit